jgi:hypothetical protein
MNIVDIVEIIPNALWSAWFEGHEVSELDRLFEQWADLEYLDNFFAENEADLSTDFYNKCSIAQAVEITYDDAPKFEEKILIAAEGKGKLSLGDIFRPLDKEARINISWEKSKAYGGGRNWLRIYGIRIATDVYVITGGAIKLTQKMQDREHTNLELDKLNAVKLFLKERDIESSDDLSYIDFDE